ATVLPPLIRTYIDMSTSDEPLTKNLKLLATSIEPVMEALSQLKDEHAGGDAAAHVELLHRAHAAELVPLAADFLFGGHQYVPSRLSILITSNCHSTMSPSLA
ncbi:hypothetical protein PPH41_27090, partial [Burkholderia gladioli]|nr:hypothetical protein [Burkholderia gladioli]